MPGSGVATLRTVRSSELASNTSVNVSPKPQLQVSAPPLLHELPLNEKLVKSPDLLVVNVRTSSYVDEPVGITKPSTRLTARVPANVAFPVVLSWPYLPDAGVPPIAISNVPVADCVYLPAWNVPGLPVLGSSGLTVPLLTSGPTTLPVPCRVAPALTVVVPLKVLALEFSVPLAILRPLAVPEPEMTPVKTPMRWTASDYLGAQIDIARTRQGPDRGPAGSDAGDIERAFRRTAAVHGNTGRSPDVSGATELESRVRGTGRTYRCQTSIFLCAGIEGFGALLSAEIPGAADGAAESLVAGVRQDRACSRPP